MPLTDREIRERVARIDSLLERIEAISDPAARDLALASVQAIVDLYGEGLGHIVAHIADRCDDETSLKLADAFGRDELVSHLLLLHGLHPDGPDAAIAPERGAPTAHSHEPELVSLQRARRVEGGHGAGRPAALLTS